MMTPSEVCKQLNISPSTLRKYSLRFESEGILFKRNKSNSRIYTVTEVAALRDSMTVTKSGQVRLDQSPRRHHVRPARPRLLGGGHDLAEGRGRPLNLAHAIPSSMVAKFLCANESCSDVWRALARIDASASSSKRADARFCGTACRMAAHRAAKSARFPAAMTDLPEHTATWLRDALPVPELTSAQVH